ncbi:MAG: CehA/McbA family metallohydrolase [Methanocorpusculum sp.]|nr:CehA/McbA family metallohydrolase [Methanocorpusculum sp.]MDE2522390.1 CehA/McbA family metallohydrolase [Methanocorpusculum sp.]MDE2525351.1 CehA/McbA family metallohydrolase [Methanocorpusculum sp.]
MVLLKCDLHVHTNASRDGESPVEAVLAAAAAAGLDAVAITDHDTTEGSICALAAQHPGVLVIPGIEVSTKQGHLLVLGTTQVLAPKQDVLDTIAEAKALGAVTIVPHPFHRWRHGVGLRCREALLAADAVETLNSRYIIGTANQKAAKMAKKYRRPATAGSDAHNCKFVGFGVTEIEAEERSVAAILDAIRAGRVSCTCKKTPLRTYTRQSWDNTVRKMRRRVPQFRHRPRRRVIHRKK